MYSETVINHRHDVWDVHASDGRWWVVTNPTNLYSQDQFPNMDLAVSLHMGICLRIPRTEKQKGSGRHLLPFADIFAQLNDTADALGQAKNLADYQGIGVRSRETLLAFVAVVQDVAEWTAEPRPKRADFRAWSEIICHAALAGAAQKERRHLFKTLLSEAWGFTNWLTHAKSTTWHDAEAAHGLTEYALGFAVSLVLRHIRDVPEQCPACGSPHLAPEEGIREDLPGVLWERPVCADCSWSGTPVPVAEHDENTRKTRYSRASERMTGNSYSHPYL